MTVLLPASCFCESLSVACLSSLVLLSCRLQPYLLQSELQVPDNLVEAQSQPQQLPELLRWNAHHQAHGFPAWLERWQAVQLQLLLLVQVQLQVLAPPTAYNLLWRGASIHDRRYSFPHCVKLCQHRMQAAAWAASGCQTSSEQCCKSAKSQFESQMVQLSRKRRCCHVPPSLGVTVLQFRVPTGSMSCRGMAAML